MPNTAFRPEISDTGFIPNGLCRKATISDVLTATAAIPEPTGLFPGFDGGRMDGDLLLQHRQKANRSRDDDRFQFGNAPERQSESVAGFAAHFQERDRSRHARPGLFRSAHLRPPSHPQWGTNLPKLPQASILVLCGFALAQQNSVDLSGTVTGAKSGTAIVGAQVRLARSGLGATTDAQGKFVVAGTTSVQGRLVPHSGLSASRDGIVFEQSTDAQVRIRILDLSGRTEATVFTGRLARGSWNVVPPRLSSGLHLCRIETPQGDRSISFLAPPSQGSAPGLDLVAAGMSAARSSETAVDTLVVSKTGYRTARHPVGQLVQSGIAIALEDSSSSGSEDATIVPDPSWPCYMPDGIPPPKLGTAAFTVTLQIGAIRKAGLTKFGNRVQYDIKGGSVKGSKIDATVMDGGLDYQLDLSTGSQEIEQILILKAGSTPILMRNAGVAPQGASNARMVLDFEAPNSSSYTWLHTGKWAAERVLDTVAKTIRLDVYDISNVKLPASSVRIQDPTGTPNQTWECFTNSGSQGGSVFTETVTLASSVSIGASKRGSRNIIPITGGTVTGKVSGKVVPGGADYQLGGLDARYSIETNDGELIIIRNCGPGTLIPVFETRVAGPYNYLNENKYLSSSPNMVNGGVSITFYEIK